MSLADPTQFKITKTARLPGISLCIALLPHSQKLFVGGSDFKVRELDMAADKPQPVEFTGEGHQSYVTGAAITGPHLVTGGYDGRLIWWDIEKREPVRAVVAHDKWMRGLVASPTAGSSPAWPMTCGARCGIPLRGAWFTHSSSTSR